VVGGVDVRRGQQQLDEATASWRKTLLRAGVEDLSLPVADLVADIEARWRSCHIVQWAARAQPTLRRPNAAVGGRRPILAADEGRERH
jgi:hypothetical protein